MGEERILIDTNSYLRLAQNIHPLLLQKFGKKKFTLYPHSKLAYEISRNSRLKNKFNWFSESQYVENRKQNLYPNKEERKDIELAYEAMWALVEEENLGPSEVDTRIVAYGAALQIRIVTDDADMIELAQTYGVHQISSMELMKLMLDVEHIDMEKVTQVVEQWIYDKDFPNGQFRKDFKRIFGVAAP